MEKLELNMLLKIRGKKNLIFQSTHDEFSKTQNQNSLEIQRTTQQWFRQHLYNKFFLHCQFYTYCK